MDWFCWVCMVAQGVFCYWMGTRVAEAENKNAFKPTQETWLELEKFRWTHKCQSISEDD